MREKARGSGLEKLRPGLWPQFRRNGTDEFRIEAELAENGPDLAERHGGRLQFHVNDVVIAIDLVMKSGDRPQLDIQLEDLVQLADIGRVNFQLQHAAMVEGR